MGREPAALQAAAGEYVWVMLDWVCVHDAFRWRCLDGTCYTSRHYIVRAKQRSVAETSKSCRHPGSSKLNMPATNWSPLNQKMVVDLHAPVSLTAQTRRSRLQLVLSWVGHERGWVFANGIQHIIEHGVEELHKLGGLSSDPRLIARGGTAIRAEFTKPWCWKIPSLLVSKTLQEVS